MILLDTCVRYHWSAGTIPAYVREVIESTELRFLHAISAWEMACKYRDGKYPMMPNPNVWIQKAIESLHLTVLNGDIMDGITAALLPLHLKDPADRLLIAVAKRLNCPAVTSDTVWLQYDVRTIWERPAVIARNRLRRIDRKTGRGKI